MFSLSKDNNNNNFFNKVVQRKGEEKKYYFVLYFDITEMILQLCPLYKQGIFTGKRSGRTRWKIVQCNNQILHNERADMYEIISTQMVAKTPFVANETWDILVD